MFLSYGIYKYLGAEIDAENNRVTKVNARIGKYTKSFLMMYPLLKEKTLPREVKGTIYYTMLRPTLLYESECWAVTFKTRSNSSSGRDEGPESNRRSEFAN